MPRPINGASNVNFSLNDNAIRRIEDSIKETGVAGVNPGTVALGCCIKIDDHRPTDRTSLNFPLDSSSIDRIEDSIRDTGVAGVNLGTVALGCCIRITDERPIDKFELADRTSLNFPLDSSSIDRIEDSIRDTGVAGVNPGTVALGCCIRITDERPVDRFELADRLESLHRP